MIDFITSTYIKWPTATPLTKAAYWGGTDNPGLPQTLLFSSACCLYFINDQRNVHKSQTQKEVIWTISLFSNLHPYLAALKDCVKDRSTGSKQSHSQRVQYHSLTPPNHFICQMRRAQTGDCCPKTLSNTLRKEKIQYQNERWIIFFCKSVLN